MPQRTVTSICLLTATVSAVPVVPLFLESWPRDAFCWAENITINVGKAWWCYYYNGQTLVFRKGLSWMTWVCFLENFLCLAVLPQGILIFFFLGQKWLSGLLYPTENELSGGSPHARNFSFSPHGWLEIHGAPCESPFSASEPARFGAAEQEPPDSMCTKKNIRCVCFHKHYAFLA